MYVLVEAKQRLFHGASSRHPNQSGLRKERPIPRRVEESKILPTRPQSLGWKHPRETKQKSGHQGGREARDERISCGTKTVHAAAVRHDYGWLRWRRIE